MLSLMSSIEPIPLLLAITLSTHGLRKKSLSPSGAAAAFVIGLSTMSVPVRSFGVSLILFYLLGSRATKVGRARKAALEEGHDARAAGYRGAGQVFANSCSAWVCAQVWSALFVRGSFASILIPEAWIGGQSGVVYDSGWCPVSVGVAEGWSRALLFGALGHFACCLGDTLASELGILSRSWPVLITSFKRVPPGTNGALSVIGTLASLAGGFAMGLTLAISLAIENSACRQAWRVELVPLLYWGTIAGGFGSLLDSMLGATLQQTRQSSKTKRIIPDEFEGPVGDVQVVSGLNFLSNSQVNLITSIVVAYGLSHMA